MHQADPLKRIRENLMNEGLMESAAPSNPMDLFDSWIAYAEELDFHNANAMTVATVNTSMEPSLRNVLLRGRLGEALVFYTNYESDKAIDLDQNKNAAVLMGWLELERQIRLTGEIEKVDEANSDQYFSSRTRGSQISAVISQQSRPIDSRSELEEAWSRLDAGLVDQSPNRPSNWGGYAFTPVSIEFWQGRPNRLHDRLRYQRDNGGWTMNRLAP
ncbi:MAG: pyridoxamine 5'-phosphate oxidase [Acidimicrobiales bacterium]|nr:pyridoxamine 5'-phosphate oxidase [Acidimicrobiales bacterium]